MFSQNAQEVEWLLGFSSRIIPPFNKFQIMGGHNFSGKIAGRKICRLQNFILPPQLHPVKLFFPAEFFAHSHLFYCHQEFIRFLNKDELFVLISPQPPIFAQITPLKYWKNICIVKVKKIIGKKSAKIHLVKIEIKILQTYDIWENLGTSII